MRSNELLPGLALRPEAVDQAGKMIAGSRRFLEDVLQSSTCDQISQHDVRTEPPSFMSCFAQIEGAPAANILATASGGYQSAPGTAKGSAPTALVHKSRCTTCERRS